MTGLALAFFLAAAQANAPEPGMIQASGSNFPAASGASSVNVIIKRTEGTSGTVTCSYTTVDGTAVAPTHYTTKSGTLTWNSGDSSDKTITILVNNATATSRTFSILLTSPTGGASLGVAPLIPPKNHLGRDLGTPVAVTTPIDWATTAMDNVMTAMQLMPANNPWNEAIDNTTAYPVHPNSANIIAFMNGASNLALNRDMNFVLVPANQDLVAPLVDLIDYPDESNLPPYPIPPNAPIEGWPVDDTRSLANIQQDIPLTGGDRHVLVLNAGTMKLYEFWQTRMIDSAGTHWEASNEATFNVRSNTLRQAGWTSGDAAGLPIMTSIPRYDECQRGLVEHAMRFTAHCRAGYVYPGNHSAPGKIGGVTVTDPNAPIMGQRFRLKNNAGVTTKINGMGTHAKAIALGLQKFGMFMADNGGDWRMSAGSDPRMTNTTLNNLTTLVPSDFEVIQTTGANQGPRATSTTMVTLAGTGGGGGDTTPPLITIQGPTGGTTYATGNASEIFSGIASDDTNLVSVTWTNPAVAGGGGSGTASGSTTWNASIGLAVGINTLTFTAHDAAGNVTSDIVTVTYTPPAPGSPSGGGGGGGGGGGCGLSGLELLPLLLLRKLRRHS